MKTLPFATKVFIPLVLLVLCMLTFASPLLAEDYTPVYMSRDDKGIVSFSDNPNAGELVGEYRNVTEEEQKASEERMKRLIEYDMERDRLRLEQKKLQSQRPVVKRETVIVREGSKNSGYPYPYPVPYPYYRKHHRGHNHPDKDMQYDKHYRDGNGWKHRQPPHAQPYSKTDPFGRPLPMKFTPQRY